MLSLQQKLLYAPVEKLLIFQPEERFFPHHDLLPSGSCLYTFWVIPCRIRMIWWSKYILQRPSFSTYPTHLRFLVTYLHMDLLAPLHGTTTWTPTRDLCVLWSIKSLSTLGRWIGSNIGKCGGRFWLLKGSTAVLSWTDVPKQSMWICANPFFVVSFLRRREPWKHFSRPFSSWEGMQILVIVLFPKWLQLLWTIAVISIH